MISSKTRAASRLIAAVGVSGLAAVALLGCTSAGGGDGGQGGGDQGGGDVVRVAYFIPTNVVERYEALDRPFFEEAMAELAPDAQVSFYNAQDDPAAQLRQAEQAITEGADILVLNPVDLEAAKSIVEQAKQAGATVIGYDRAIPGAAVDFYVQVDGVEVGELQGQWIADNTADGDVLAVINGSESDDNAHAFRDGYMSVLQPLFDSGARVLGYESWTPDWDPANAQRQMEQALTQLDNGVQGVMAANDGTAGGAIAALASQGLAGTVPVTGLDATIPALQRIVEGTQGMSVWRSLKEQSRLTAELIVSIINDEDPGDIVTSTREDGGVEIPWVTVTPMIIDATNIDLVVEDGAATKEEICAGVSNDAIGFCD
ncbi:ABC transporter substrate-binding protein [Microbacterium sp. No. 7]|uniref:ABC transporter substrate-binding protein n=1 Tax=Microbacterium sp. No. 7 TaxID=1714373 RepID=UPI0006CFEECF|nr:sugar ABC transporter substrate-binding protein [Microbacterium sp. No. 7]ALJ21757.1 hypothetical protein AOA12_18405 [Microbacterium sp. No. 7]